jgi:hypothetical protein
MAGATTSKRGPAEAYSASEVWGLFEGGWAQPTASRRDAVLGLLLLVLSTGATPPVIKSVHGTDVFAIDGQVQVLVSCATGLRRFWARDRYAQGLIAVAERAGEKLLLGSYVTGVNVTGNLTWRIDLGPDLPRLDVWRLIATYQSDLARDLDLDVLGEALGHFNFDTIGQLARRLPPPSPDRVATVLRGPADNVRGPWEPDWRTGHRATT